VQWYIVVTTRDEAVAATGTAIGSNLDSGFTATRRWRLVVPSSLDPAVLIFTRVPQRADERRRIFLDRVTALPEARFRSILFHVWIL
jgi:hypothetical protein